MASSDISKSVCRLIHDYIPSVERLEILLLLAEAKDRSWSVETIEQRIRSAPDSIRQNVSALVAEHFVVVANSSQASPRFQYHPASPEQDETVAALAVAYRTHRVAVIELIYTDRRDSARRFSEAFKLGRTHDR